MNHKDEGELANLSLSFDYRKSISVPPLNSMQESHMQLLIESFNKELAEYLDQADLSEFKKNPIEKRLHGKRQLLDYFKSRELKD